MTMPNAEIAAHFEELATLYELDGAIQYRVLAYRQAAKAIAESAVSVAQMAKEGRLRELAGIGATLEQKIDALLETGEIPAATKLKEKYPPSLVELTWLPGLGAKTARRLHEELGVASIDDLRAAAEAGRIRELKGLGPKFEQKILAALATFDPREAAPRRLLSDVRAIAETLVAALREHPACNSVEIAGSVRRWTDTCKDVDLIATADDRQALVEHFIALPLIGEVRSSGEAGAKVLTHNAVAVDLRIVEPGQYGNLLQHFTGSKSHNVQLREDAVRRGLSVSEYGITDAESGETIRCETEAEVYERLGFAYIEPELREGRGELEAARAGDLPRLLTVDDIRGDLHCHTTLSDGRDTLEEMAQAARDRGYAYLAVTDHSASHGFGKHVTAKQLEARIDEVAELRQGLGRFRLLAGSEVNIGVDGSLDYPDELLSRLDWVIASVHTSFGMSEERMTGRVLEAIEHPSVDCVGHLTGRMILRREPYRIDIEKVAEAAARTGTMLEINSNPRRRDLNDVHARLAAEAGAMIVVTTDAHGADTLDLIRYGVATARRAWLSPDRVGNTRSWGEFSKLRKRR